MNKLLLNASLVVLALSSWALGPSAQANHSPYLQTQFNQWVYPGNDVRIRQLLGIDGRYNGYRVDYVTFSAQSQYGYVAANLEINGYLVQPTQSISPGFYQYTIPVHRILGNDIQTLQLSVHGGPVWISVIGVQLSQQPHYGPAPQPGYPPPHPGNGGGYRPPHRPDPGPGPGRPGPGHPGGPRPGPGRPGPGR